MNYMTKDSFSNSSNSNIKSNKVFKSDNGSVSRNNENSKPLNEPTRIQIEMLKIMSGMTNSDKDQDKNSLKNNRFSSDFPIFSMQELRAKTSLKDDAEVQRYLFILEGQKLVEPNPKGDLTSTFWKISDLGFKTLKRLINLLDAA